MRLRFVPAALAVTVLSSACFATVVRLQAAKDNTIFAENSELSNGIGTSLFAGETSVGQIRRGLIAFDLSSIPAGATINSATLTMRMSRTTTGSEPVELHFALSSWGEGTSNANTKGGGGGAPASAQDATWSHRFFGGEEWSTPGGDFRADSSALAAVAGVGFYSWTGLAADAQAWLDSPSSNNGWVIRGNETINQSAKRFDSREALTAANRPVLEVDYTIPTPGNLLTLAGAAAFGSFRRRR